MKTIHMFIHTMHDHNCQVVLPPKKCESTVSDSIQNTQFHCSAEH